MEKVVIGNATLYLGDCRDILEDHPAVDLVLTDPPYGVTYVSNASAGKGTIPITNDGTRLSLALYRQVLPLLKAKHLLWFTRWDAWPDVWMNIGQHFPVRGVLIWDKGTPGMGDLSHWGLSYEMIASAGTGKLTGGRDGSILKFNGVPSRNRLHPTEKPIALLQYLIQKLAPETVLDPFMGSGTTGAAAVASGCNFVGMEIDRKNFDNSCQRIEQAQSQLQLGL